MGGRLLWPVLSSVWVYAQKGVGNWPRGRGTRNSHCGRRWAKFRNLQLGTGRYNVCIFSGEGSNTAFVLWKEGWELEIHPGPAEVGAEDLEERLWSISYSLLDPSQETDQAVGDLFWLEAGKEASDCLGAMKIISQPFP